jgi:T-complex protein 1 subunit delta
MANGDVKFGGGGGKRGGQGSQRVFKDKEKPEHVRDSNIEAAKAVVDAIRTALGPRGMDKMIMSGNGDVTITNDGATILKQMQVLHPAAKMLVELSKAQDIEAGDGTTSVCIMAGSLLEAARRLLHRGIHPTTISEAFQKAAHESIIILETISRPVDLSDKSSLIKSASTSLNSKVVSQYSSILAPMAVDCVLRVMDTNDVDLRNVRIFKKLGGVVEDTVMIDGGLVLDQKTKNCGGPSRIEKAKIGIIQFCISAPKTDMENQVIISDYTQMDRVLKEERAYILNIVKGVKKAGCNVLLIQKSILRDAVSDLALHFLAKMKIMVIADIERDDIEFISNTLGVRPIASLDHMLPEHLASADLADEVNLGVDKVVKITGIAEKKYKTVTVLLRGSNKLMLDEADRSLHDALCVIRCLVKKRFIVAGGGVPEIEVSLKLAEISNTLSGMDAYCFRAFAEAMEVIPYTLAENAGLNPIQTVTELRNRHANGDVNAGINVRKGAVTNINEENVLQPLLVTTSALTLATETVRSILKIDDIVNAARD